MKRKGFTLIELLAVIVILAIIALIAVPVIMNIIAKSNKSAFKDSAYGIIKAGELYYSDKLLEQNGMEEDKTFTFPNSTDLEIKGTKPTSGKMKVTREGKVALAITNGKYCVRKGFDETEVTVDENISDCNLSKEPNPNISSSEVCATKDGEVCSAGVKVNVKVNDSENYDFYVIADTGTELTLIMDRNLGSSMAWISKEDYAIANIDGTVCNFDSCTDEGPLTVLPTLEMRTNNWVNVNTMTYTLADDGGGNKYKPIERKNVRSRLLNMTEVIQLGCLQDVEKSCPNFLYENLSDSSEGYWTSTADPDLPHLTLPILVDGYFTRVNVIVLSEAIGARPVIEVSKTV